MLRVITVCIQLYNQLQMKNSTEDIQEEQQLLYLEANQSFAKYSKYRIRSNYRTYPYKRSHSVVFSYSQCSFFSLLLYKGIC